jgi:hypothetical protein
MKDPRDYCRKIKSNKLARFWLLQGNAGAVMVRDCDPSATVALGSILPTVLSPSGAISVATAADKVQESLKSDVAEP